VKAFAVVLLLALGGCQVLRDDPEGTGLFEIRQGDCSITKADVNLTGGTGTLGGFMGSGDVYVRRGDCDEKDWQRATEST